MSQVTGVPTVFSGFAAGTRAIQLPDVRVQNQFLTSFGRPERVICDAAERSSDPSIAQALHVINGDTLNKKLSAPDGYVTLFLKLGLSDRKILDHMFLSAYSRYPKAEEAAQRHAGQDNHRSRQQGHEILRPPLARQRPECAVALASRSVGGRVGHACRLVP